MTIYAMHSLASRRLRRDKARGIKNETKVPPAIQSGMNKSNIEGF